jgi:type IX secretion system PorP/SprF family membrane protein
MKAGIYTMFAVLIISLSASAQKDLQFTLNQFTGSVFNPALTSADRSYRATLLARQQWIDFSKAPATQFLTLEMPAWKKHSIGIALVHDKLGYENNYDLTLNYSFFIKLSDTRSLGLGAGLNLLVKNLDGTQLIYDDMTDPNAVYDNVTRYNLNANAGLSYNAPRLTVGVSTRHLNASAIENTEIFSPARYYYLYAAWKLPLNEHLTLQPNGLLKTNLQNWEYNAGLLAEFENTLRFGFNYRHSESFALLVGLTSIKNLEVMYAYDIINGTLSDVSPSSHELVLRYSVKPKPPKLPYLKSPRYFN